MSEIGRSTDLVHTAYEFDFNHLKWKRNFATLLGAMRRPTVTSWALKRNFRERPLGLDPETDVARRTAVIPRLRKATLLGCRRSTCSAE